MQPAQLSDLGKVFEKLVTSLLVMGAIGMFVMLLTAGFKYLNSGGDPKATEAAQKTLTYAIGGFVLFAFSFMILVLIGRFTGTESLITKFTIYRK